MGAIGEVHLGRGSQFERPPRNRLRDTVIDGALDLILRFDLPLDALLRWSDSDSSLCDRLIVRVSQNPSQRLSNRLVTHTVFYGLAKLSGKLDEIRSSTSAPEWQHFTESVAPALLNLEKSKNATEVLYYGNEIFHRFRDFAEEGTDRALGKTLSWHHLFFEQQSGIKIGPPEILDSFENDDSVSRVARLSKKVRADLRIRSGAVELKGADRKSDLDVEGGNRAPDLDIRDAVQESSGPPELPEPPRYTDLTIYRGGHFKGDTLEDDDRLSDDRPLIAGKDYTLEVAIRLKRKGIGANSVPSRPVINPRKDRERLTVYVLARALGYRGEQLAEVAIKEPFAKITWPYDSNSDSALFRLKVSLASSAERSEGTIQVRLYDQSLDLLDIVSASFTIVDQDQGVTSTAGVVAQHVCWPNERAGTDLSIDPKSPERSLSIHVNGLPKGYNLEFLFKNSGGEIEVGVSRFISTQDLVNLLVKVRDYWTDLVVTNYSDDLNVTRTTFEKYLAQLAELGNEAWLLLFGDRTGGLSGASEAIGDLLKSLDLGEGKIVQITYDDSSRDFVFPWSILYPPLEDEEKIDPYRFWGARYQIEQTTESPRDDRLASEPIRVLFALDPSFGDSSQQTALFKEYSVSQQHRLQVTEPVKDEGTLFTLLQEVPSAHLLYFYCHGYTSGNPGPLRLDGAQKLAEIIKNLPEGSPQRTALEVFRRLLMKPGSESWMYIGDSEIKESKLKQKSFFQQRRPIVFLNACQSADLLPSISSGLVRVFLDHNASAVLGTESPMTSTFANAFAKDVLNDLFGGENVGRALWNARRHFLGAEMRNPLGLAYTLYGRSTARLGGGPNQGPDESNSTG